jgi:glycosyltransferase involved in cell wall biosynthesis
MPESPYFSIIIPTYNRADLIGGTIASALAQHDRDLEVIVVDDGSTDDTEAVVQAIADPRVRYLRKENAERGAARNYGAVRARGRYVNFFDSDDLLYPNHLTAARDLIEQRGEPEFIYLAVEMRDRDGKLLFPSKKLTGDVAATLIRGNGLGPNGVFLRRDIALACPFNEDRRLSGSEDWELGLRLASRYPIHYSNEITSVVVNHESRSVLQADEQALLTRKDLTLKYLFEDDAFVARFGHSRRFIEAEFLSYIALHLALDGRPLRAAKYLKDSVRSRPSAVFERRFLAVIKHITIGALRPLRRAQRSMRP